MEETFDDDQRTRGYLALQDAAMGLGRGWKIVDLRDVGGDLEQSGQVTARSPPKAPPRFSP